MRFLSGTSVRVRHFGFGILLALITLPAAAQSAGPITIQSLFLNQSSNTHHGNYLEADAGLLYNDNVNLTPSGSGDGIALIGLLGNIERLNAPRFDYHLDSDIVVAKYFKSEYSTQPYGYLDGFGEFKIDPGTLSWIGRETFSQLLLNQTAPATPNNLESINYISTGPRLTLRPTLRTSIVLDGTYSFVDSNSKSPQYVNINNHQLGGDLRIERAFTNTFSAYLTGNYAKVQFSDTTVNQDFNYVQGLLGIRLGDARTVLDLASGYNQAHVEGAPPSSYPVPHGALLEIPSFDEAAATTTAPAATTTNPSNTQNPSGSTWQANLSRLISPTQRVSLHALKQVTDSANLFRLNLDQPVPGNQQSQLATGQPLTHREYGGTWRYDNGRTAVTLNGLYYSDHYSQTPLTDHDSRQVNALVSRELNVSFHWELGFLYEHDNYIPNTQHTWNAITSLRWRVGPKIGLRFFYTHSDVGPGGYSDNQIGVIASYALSAGAKAADTMMKPTAPTSQPYY
jgi:hypothetical protein